MDFAERQSLLAMEDAELREVCVASFTKGTGNGGQKINKTSSAVTLFHAETGISASSMESRSQSVNTHIALKKLRFRIACKVRCNAEPFRLLPAPSMENHRYPAWIAQLFDHLAENAWDLKEAAPGLGTSRSKLTKLLQRDPSLWREFLYESHQ